MLVLITYDVKTEEAAGKKRLHRIAKICCDYGQRVQNSVFECDLDQAQLVVVKDKLLKAMDDEEDSLRFYYLGNRYSQKNEQFGKKRSYDPEGVLLV